MQTNLKLQVGICIQVPQNTVSKLCEKLNLKRANKRP